jgi:hypothetical protein
MIEPTEQQSKRKGMLRRLDDNENDMQQGVSSLESSQSDDNPNKIDLNGKNYFNHEPIYYDDMPSEDQKKVSDLLGRHPGNFVILNLQSGLIDVVSGHIFAMVTTANAYGSKYESYDKFKDYRPIIFDKKKTRTKQ